MNHIIGYTKRNDKHITIVFVKCLFYISQIIMNELIKLGWKCNIIHMNEIDYYMNLNNLSHYFLFLLSSQINKKIIHYKRYILYQLEQNNNQLSMNYKYLHEKGYLKQIYDNATLLIDYCQLNVDVLNKYYTNTFKIMNIPIIHNESNRNELYEYDIIFIGSINQKRERILNKVKEKYKVLIVENIYGEELKLLCNKCYICLNIHYYENAILERVRLNEMMDYGIQIISEKPCDQDMNICKYYKSIHFIEMINDSNDLHELFNTIDYVKNNPNNHDSKELENIFKKDIKNIFNLSNTI